MKQTVFNNGSIQGVGQVTHEIEWQGGHGWLVVEFFAQTAGSPDMAVDFTAGSLVFNPISSPIVAPGVYPFYAPKTLVRCTVESQAAEQVSFGAVYFLGDQ